MDQDIKEIVLTFGGVIIGFVLSEGANSIRTYKEVTRAGKSFDYEVSAFKPILQMQVGHLKNFYKEVQDYVQASPKITIIKNESYAHIDREKVVRYYSRKEEISEALRLFNLKINRIWVVESEIERFLKYYQDFATKVDLLLVKYSSISNRFFHVVAEYCRESKGLDEYAATVMNEALKYCKEIIYNIVVHKVTLHKNLFDMDSKNRTHVLHNPIRNLLEDGGLVIEEMEAINKDFLDAINSITTTLENCYLDMYIDYGKKSIS
jgi:hypothetical protein